MTPASRTDLLKGAFSAAVAAADPFEVVPAALPPPPPGRLLVVGAGKAAAAMAQAVERHYLGANDGDVSSGDTPGAGGHDAAPAHPPRLEGIVVTRYGHARPTRRIVVREASHPVPDAAGAAATQEILALAGSAGPDDLVLCLLSGGGSALLTAPRGVTLAQKAALTRELLRSGADIHEMNAVRKHLSAVKGGWLAVACAPARLHALAISDVVGDDLSTIASGPTVPDPTTFADALAVLERYRITAPEARRQFARGLAGEVPETPKPGHPAFATSDTRLLAGNQRSLEAAAAYLGQRGYAAHILSSTVTGEARTVGDVHAAIARQVLERQQPFAPPCALISGGETTVTVRGEGRGGRNSEFALGLALALPSGHAAGERLHLLAADSDGIDGSEANAGVFVTPALFASLDRQWARGRLDANDSYAVFAKHDHLFATGPTGTNVNDLRIILLD